MYRKLLMILFALSVNRVASLEYIKFLPGKFFGRHYRHTPWVSPFKRLSLEQLDNIKKIVIIFEELLPLAQECSAEIKGYLPSDVVYGDTDDWLIARAPGNREYHVYKINNARWTEQLSVDQRIKLEKLVTIVKGVSEEYSYLMSLYCRDNDFRPLAGNMSVSASDCRDSQQVIFKQAFDFYNPVALCFIIKSFLMTEGRRSKDEPC